jgi:hypothetical protein
MLLFLCGFVTGAVCVWLAARMEIRRRTNEISGAIGKLGFTALLFGFALGAGSVAYINSRNNGKRKNDIS